MLLLLESLFCQRDSTWLAEVELQPAAGLQPWANSAAARTLTMSEPTSCWKRRAGVRPLSTCLVDRTASRARSDRSGSAAARRSRHPASPRRFGRHATCGRSGSSLPPPPGRGHYGEVAIREDRSAGCPLVPVSRRSRAWNRRRSALSGRCNARGRAGQGAPAGSMAAASSPAWRMVKASMICERPRNNARRPPRTGSGRSAGPGYTPDQTPIARTPAGSAGSR